MANEPCVVCGEETAVGSLFYSDRHVMELDGPGPKFLCGLCHSKARARGSERLTEADVSKALLGTDKCLPGARNRGGFPS